MDSPRPFLQQICVAVSGVTLLLYALLICSAQVYGSLQDPLLDDCDCGEGMISCFEYRSKKACECEHNKYVLGGNCEDCKCHNGVCNAETGKCLCNKGFGLNGDTCEECDCGTGTSCHFVEGVQFCNCADIYIAVDERCQDCVCDANQVCTKVDRKRECDCLQSADTWSEDCNDCDCSSGKGCSYTVSEKQCRCIPGTVSLDGQCVECLCGENAECSFVNGTKTCTCSEGYEEKENGTCEECHCGQNAECSFVNGTKTCTCSEGYEEKENGTCEVLSKVVQECFCGEGHSCEISDGGTKVCLCQHGYADDDGTCRECSCGRNSTCRFEEGEPVCVYDYGYGENNGTWEELCGEDVCKNGKCEIEGDSYHCDCADGFTGITCDEGVVFSKGMVILISAACGTTLFLIILVAVYVTKRRLGNQDSKKKDYCSRPPQFVCVSTL